MGIIVPLKFQTFCPIISHLIVPWAPSLPSPATRPSAILTPLALSPLPHRRLLWEKCAETSSIHKSKSPKKQWKRQFDFWADFKLLGNTVALTWLANTPFNILCKVS